jgi:hypothetical protein
MSPNALRLLACSALATLWLLLLLWCCLPVPAGAAALSHAIPLPNHKKGHGNQVLNSSTVHLSSINKISISISMHMVEILFKEVGRNLED